MRKSRQSRRAPPLTRRASYGARTIATDLTGVEVSQRQTDLLPVDLGTVRGIRGDGMQTQ